MPASNSSLNSSDLNGIAPLTAYCASNTAGDIVDFVTTLKLDSLGVVKWVDLVDCNEDEVEVEKLLLWLDELELEELDDDEETIFREGKLDDINLLWMVWRELCLNIRNQASKKSFDSFVSPFALAEKNGPVF